MTYLFLGKCDNSPPQGITGPSQTGPPSVLILVTFKSCNPVQRIVLGFLMGNPCQNAEPQLPAACDAEHRASLDCLALRLGQARLTALLRPGEVEDGDEEERVAVIDDVSVCK